MFQYFGSLPAPRSPGRPPGHVMAWSGILDVIAEHHVFCKYCFAATCDLLSCVWRCVGGSLHEWCDRKDRDFHFDIWYPVAFRGLAEESCMVAEIIGHYCELRGVRDRAWQLNQFALESVGCPTCSAPSWCDLRRCRERITGLQVEGVRRDILGPTPQCRHQTQNWKRGVSETSRAAAAPEFNSTGTNPRTGHHWTACLCLVKRRR